MKKKFKRLLFVVCVIIIILCYRSGITNADVKEAFDFSRAKETFATEVQPHLDDFAARVKELLSTKDR